MHAIKRHLTLFQLAYDNDAWRPKHHMALHLAQQLAHFGYLLSCFCVERKHRMVRRYALNRRGANTEQGLMEDITIQQCIELSESHVGATHGFLKDLCKPQGHTLAALEEMFGYSSELLISHRCIANGCVCG